MIAILLAWEDALSLYQRLLGILTLQSTLLPVQTTYILQLYFLATQPVKPTSWLQY